MFACQLWISPGLPRFSTAHKEPRTGGGVSSIDPCVAEDFQPGRAEGMPALQPVGSSPRDHRPTARGSAAIGLDTWWKQRKKNGVLGLYYLLYWWKLHSEWTSYTVINNKHTFAVRSVKLTPNIYLSNEPWLSLLLQLSAHLVFEWCSISSASRQTPCKRGPRVRMSITMATQPNNISGDSRVTAPVVMAASTAAHTLGKCPRGRGMRKSWSCSDCICQQNRDPIMKPGH